MAIQGDVAKYLSGLPIEVKGCNIAITQPRMRDVCAFGEEDFLLTVSLFVNDKELISRASQGNPQLKRYDDFQILLVVLGQEKEMMRRVQDLFSLIFPNYYIQFSAGCIDFRIEEGGRIVGRIDPRGYPEFKRTLRELFLPSNMEDSDDSEFHPVNDKAAEIAKKLAQAREKRAKMKRDQKGGKRDSLFAIYLSSLSIGLQMDVNVLLGYTPFQLYDAFLRFSSKMAYDLYQDIATTPFADVSKMDSPQNWIGNIYA